MPSASEPPRIVDSPQIPQPAPPETSLVLDVVLGGVRVHQRVDHVEALVVGRVDGHEGIPLLGERVLGEDRLDRALRLARAAVDALLRVDHEHPVRLVDAIDRTDVDAGLVLDVDARLADHVRHAVAPAVAAPWNSGASSRYSTLS